MDKEPSGSGLQKEASITAALNMSTEFYLFESFQF